VAAIIFILSISLTVIQHLRLYYEHVKKEDLSVSTSAVLIVAIFVQQGTDSVFILAKRLSSAVQSILLELGSLDFVEFLQHSALQKHATQCNKYGNISGAVQYS
jgi:hypothetical protein